MNEAQKALVKYYLKEFREFAGWDLEMIVGYYQQFFYKELTEKQIEEAILEGMSRK